MLMGSNAVQVLIVVTLVLLVVPPGDLERCVRQLRQELLGRTPIASAETLRGHEVELALRFPRRRALRWWLLGALALLVALRCGLATHVWRLMATAGS